MAATPRQAEPRDLTQTAQDAAQSHSDGQMARALTDAFRADGTLVLSRDQQLQILTALTLNALAHEADATEKRRAHASISLHDTLDQASALSDPATRREAMSNLCTKARHPDLAAKSLRDLADLLYDAKEIRVTLSPSQLASSAGGGQ